MPWSRQIRAAIAVRDWRQLCTIADSIAGDPEASPEELMAACVAMGYATLLTGSRGLAESYIKVADSGGADTLALMSIELDGAALGRQLARRVRARG